MDSFRIGGGDDDDDENVQLNPENEWQEVQGDLSISSDDNDQAASSSSRPVSGRAAHQHHEPHDSFHGSESPLVGGGSPNVNDFSFNTQPSTRLRKKHYEDMSPIDWSFELEKDRERNEFLKHQPGLRGKLHVLYSKLELWIILLLTGVMTGFLAGIIDVVSAWLSDLKFGHCQGAFYLSRDFCCINVEQGGKCDKWSTWPSSMGLKAAVPSYIISWIISIVLALVFASTAGYLTIRFAKYARMSGLPEIKTIAAGYVIKGFFGVQTLVIKSFGLCLVVGSGLWVGKEGPLVHVAGCCAYLASKLFNNTKSNEALKRAVLCAASAAGISVAFGAPIGGVLFTLEQIAYYANEKIMWPSFVCAMVAAVTLQVLNPFRSGKLVLFEVVFDRPWHKFEVLPFAIVGAFGGIFGTAMIRLNRYFAKWRRNNSFVKDHPLWEVVLVALITAVISYPDIYMRLQSSVLLSYLFQECSDTTISNLCNVDHWFSTFVLLLFAAGVGAVLTAYSFGINVPAGILLPSMLVGAIGGRSVGVLMHSLHIKWRTFFLFSACPPDGFCITPGVYALVGAASALTGVTRITVSSVVILFELTGALTYVLPIMTGVLVSKWVADSFGKESIYDSWIDLLDYPLLNKQDETSIPDLSVTEVMTSFDNLVRLNLDMTIADIKSVLQNSAYKGYPVIESRDDPTLVGYAPTRDLSFYFKKLSDDTAFREVYENCVETAPITTSPHATLHHANLLFQSLGLRVLMITSKGSLYGLLTRKDIWRLLGSSERRAVLVDDLGRQRQFSDAMSTLEVLLTNETI